MRKFTKFIWIILAVLLTLIIIFGVYFYNLLNDLQVDQTGVITPETAVTYPTVSGINHILLVGVDSTSTEATTRSDAMMLLTLDTLHNNVKLTSFARDAYVNIPGIGYEKLTHAYAYGGAELLIETFRQNFQVDVSNYVVIDFKSFIVLVDMLGGVDASLEDWELREFNRVANENYRKYYDGEDGFIEIQEAGTYTLNGYQTLAYVRMRKSDSIYAREERQRLVVEEVFNKVIRMPFNMYSKLFKQVLPYITTNINPFDLVKLGFTALQIGTDDVRQLEFPDPNKGIEGSLPGKGWVLQWDEESGREQLHEFLNQ
ncbi:MAG: LCP family protein [Niameybacter sp.]|uniref:LCP family protein n=1 Tax=Niameybacter sp. TaxID=2033640 RepID=UPI002FC8695F